MVIIMFIRTVLHYKNMVILSICMNNLTFEIDKVVKCCYILSSCENSVRQIDTFSIPEKQNSSLEN
jgi:hypothetical protein